MKMFTGIAAVVLALAALAGPAGADAVYHSERLEFTGGDPKFHGQVVNIHPNGPVNGALERYQVVGADAGTDYAVWIQTCDGSGLFTDFMMTTTLTTNKHGNGHAKAGFTAEDLEPFSGAVISIRWALVHPTSGIAYTTPCTTVTID